MLRGAGWWCNSLSLLKNTCTAAVVRKRLQNSGWKTSASSDQEAATIAQSCNPENWNGLNLT